MKAPAFEYVRPDGVEAIVSALTEHGDEAKVLAGGQSLVPVLNLRLSAPTVLIDIGGTQVLRSATSTAAGVRYGACVTHARVEDMVVPDPSLGLLPHVAEGIGYRAIRTRGTVVGSLVHADPSAEWPVVMSALDADVVVRSPRGERRVPVRELYVGHFTTTLEADELVTAVEIPPVAAGTTWGIHKQNRKVGEFAESLAVALVGRDDDGRRAKATVWLGAASDVPLALPGGDELVDGASVPTMDDVRDRLREILPAPSTAEERYRVHLHGVAVHRALLMALEKEEDE